MFQINILEYGNSFNWLYACLLMLVVGTLIGIFQGLLVAYFGIAAFIVTLGGLLIYRNGAWALSRGVTQAPLDENFLIIGGGRGGTIGEFWTWVVGIVACLIVIFYAFYIRRRRISYNFKVRKMWVEIMLLFIWVSIILGFAYMLNSYQRPKTDGGAGIPIPFLILVAVAAMMTLIANFTKFGRYVYAIGGNPNAARASGINVNKILVIVYSLCGFLSGIGALILAGRADSGYPNAGLQSELDAIAACIIGGASFFGGRGTVLGVFAGVMIMGILRNGLNLMDVSSFWQQVLIGSIIVLAVYIDVLRRELGTRK